MSESQSIPDAVTTTWTRWRQDRGFVELFGIKSGAVHLFDGIDWQPDEIFGDESVVTSSGFLGAIGGRGFNMQNVPLMISNALEDKSLPIYGGEVYNIGGSLALPNVEVVHKILAATGKPASLMKTVADRPGHDRPHALASGTRNGVKAANGV